MRKKIVIQSIDGTTIEIPASSDEIATAKMMTISSALAAGLPAVTITPEDNGADTIVLVTRNIVAVVLQDA